MPAFADLNDAVVKGLFEYLSRLKGPGPMGGGIENADGSPAAGR